MVRSIELLDGNGIYNVNFRIRKFIECDADAVKCSWRACNLNNQTSSSTYKNNLGVAAQSATSGSNTPSNLAPVIQPTMIPACWRKSREISFDRSKRRKRWISVPLDACFVIVASTFNSRIRLLAVVRLCAKGCLITAAISILYCCLFYWW